MNLNFKDWMEATATETEPLQIGDTVLLNKSMSGVVKSVSGSQVYIYFSDGDWFNGYYPIRMVEKVKPMPKPSPTAKADPKIHILEPGLEQEIKAFNNRSNVNKVASRPLSDDGIKFVNPGEGLSEKVFTLVYARGELFLDKGTMEHDDLVYKAHTYSPDLSARYGTPYMHRIELPILAFWWDNNDLRLCVKELLNAKLIHPLARIFVINKGSLGTATDVVGGKSPQREKEEEEEEEVYDIGGAKYSIDDLATLVRNRHTKSWERKRVDQVLCHPDMQKYPELSGYIPPGCVKRKRPTKPTWSDWAKKANLPYENTLI